MITEENLKYPKECEETEIKNLGDHNIVEKYTNLHNEFMKKLIPE